MRRGEEGLIGCRVSPIRDVGLSLQVKNQRKARIQTKQLSKVN